VGQKTPAAITQLLVAWSGGDQSALEQLMPAIYGELKRLARRHLARERGQTLQATALVHEAYIKLIDQHSVSWQNRAHFFAIAARLMRRIVMNHIRTTQAAKRGSGATHVSLEDVEIRRDERPIDLSVLDDAMTRLAALDPLQGEIIELRFFGGLTIDEIAETLAVSPGTLKRELRAARAWLYKEVA
jgi:RNA polymerase sigma factor (TIGR02999 family)